MSKIKRLISWIVALIVGLFLMLVYHSTTSVLWGFIWAVVFCVFFALMFVYFKDDGAVYPKFTRPAWWVFMAWFVGIGVVIYSWIPNYDDLDVSYYETPSRNDLYLVTGKILSRDTETSYRVDLGDRIIVIKCPPTFWGYGSRGNRGRRPVAGDCFPENIESYRDKFVEAYIQGGLNKSEYKYFIYELKSGSNILVDYDVISSKQAEVFKKTRESVVEHTREDGFFVSLYLLSSILVWIFEVLRSWRRSKKAPPQGEGAPSPTEGAAR